MRCTAVSLALIAPALIAVPPSTVRSDKGSGESVIQAERAYASMAQAKGQWTAFRATAADDAILFVPEPVDALQWLRGRPDPAHAVAWQPAAAFMSCDGSFAVTTGPWQRTTGMGYFTTIWRRDPAGWRWVLDFGDSLERARPPVLANPPVRRAACSRPKQAPKNGEGPGARSGAGMSRDGTFRWSWSSGADGSRRVVVDLWRGRGFERVIDDKVASAAKPGAADGPAGLRH